MINLHLYFGLAEFFCIQKYDPLTVLQHLPSYFLCHFVSYVWLAAGGRHAGS